MVISPSLAWSTMLRATSEMAAATRVTSVPSNPSLIASLRPSWRAVTISIFELIATRCSFPMFNVPLGVLIQIGQAFLQIEGRPHAFQRQAQLHHGKGNIRLNADDHGFGSTQFEHMGDGPKGACGKGIDDIKHGDINDDPA